MRSLHRLGPIRLHLDIELDIDEPELIALLGRVVAASGLQQTAHLFKPVEKVLSTAQLAEEIGVSSRCVSNWTKQGMPTLNAGSRPRFKLSEVTEWMRGRQSQRQRQTKQAA